MDLDTRDVQDIISLAPYRGRTTLRVSPPFEPLTKTRHSLFAISNVFGWSTVVTTPTPQDPDSVPAFVLNRLDDLITSFDQAELHDTYALKEDPSRSIIIPTTSFCSNPSVFITHVSFAAWDRLITVATSDGSIYIFSLFNLVTRTSTKPSTLLPPVSPDTPLKMIIPNPSKGGPLSGLMALVYQDGSIRVIDCYEPGKTYWTSQLATAAEWSPMGKRLFVGYTDGRLEFVTQDGISKGIIDPPQLAKDEGLSVLHIKWLDQKNYVVTYNQPGDELDTLNETFCLHVPRQSELSSSTFSRVPDAIVSDSEPSLPPGLFTTALALNPQSSWNRLVISLFSNSTALTLIGYDSSDKPFALDLGEDSLPVLPASEEEFLPTAPLGFAHSYLTSENLPLIWCLTSDGVLAIWKVKLLTKSCSNPAEVWTGISNFIDISSVAEKGIEGPPAPSTTPSSEQIVPSKGLVTSQPSALGSLDSSTKTNPFSQVTAFGQPSLSANRAPSSSAAAFGQPTGFGGLSPFAQSGSTSTAAFGKSSFGSFSGGAGGFNHFASKATQGFGNSSLTSSTGFTAFANLPGSAETATSSGFAQFTAATSQPSFLDAESTAVGINIFDNPNQASETANSNPFLKSSSDSLASGFGVTKPQSTTSTDKGVPIPDTSFKLTSKTSSSQSRATGDDEDDEDIKKQEPYNSVVNSPTSASSDVEELTSTKAGPNSMPASSSSGSALSADASEDLFNQKMTLKLTESETKDPKSHNPLLDSQPKPPSKASSLAAPFGFGGNKLPNPPRTSLLNSSGPHFQSPLPVSQSHPNLSPPINTSSNVLPSPEETRVKITPNSDLESTASNQAESAAPISYGSSENVLSTSLSLPKKGDECRILSDTELGSSKLDQSESETITHRNDPSGKPGFKEPTHSNSLPDIQQPIKALLHEESISHENSDSKQDIQAVPSEAEVCQPLSSVPHATLVTKLESSTSDNLGLEAPIRLSTSGDKPVTSTPPPEAKVPQPSPRLEDEVIVRTDSQKDWVKVSSRSDEFLADSNEQSVEGDLKSEYTSSNKLNQGNIESDNGEDDLSEEDDDLSANKPSSADNSDVRSESEGHDISRSEPNDDLATTKRENSKVGEPKGSSSNYKRDEQSQSAAQEVLDSRAHTQPQDRPSSPITAKRLFGLASSPCQPKCSQTQSRLVGPATKAPKKKNQLDSAIVSSPSESDIPLIPTTGLKPDCAGTPQPLPAAESRGGLMCTPSSVSRQASPQSFSEPAVVTTSQPNHAVKTASSSVKPCLENPVSPPPFFTKPDFSTPLSSLCVTTVPKIYVNPDAEAFRYPSTTSLTQALTKISDSITLEINCLASINLACRRYFEECHQKLHSGSFDMVQVKSKNWLFGDLHVWYQLVQYLTDRAKRKISESEARFQAVTTLDNALIKADMKLEEIKRILRLRRDPEFSQAVGSRQLGPIQLAHQKDIRRLIRDVKHGISQMSEVFQSFESRRREVAKCKNRMQVPSLDTIHRCIRYITLGLTQHIVNIEKLHLRVCRYKALVSSLKVKVEVDAPGSSLNDRSSSGPTPDQTAAVRALLSEHKGVILKESILKHNTEPILTRARMCHQKTPVGESSGLSHLGLTETLLIKPKVKSTTGSLMSKQAVTKFSF